MRARGGGTNMFIYIASDHFGGSKFWGFQKDEYFWGMKFCGDFLGVITKLD